VPDDFEVNPICLQGIDKPGFIDGLKELTAIVKLVYADMIQQPSEYGLPLVEDVEYAKFNPKAAESKNSSYRFVSLLHALVQSGELSNDLLIVDGKKKLPEICKKLKITNSKMILKKLCEFGFIYENGTLQYIDNSNVMPALYGYMKNLRLKQKAVFSLNYFLSAKGLPTHAAIFAGYLSGSEREFYEQMNEFMEANNFVVGNAADYHAFSFSIEYLIDSKDEKRIMRCYSNFGKLLIRLKLHSSDCYDYYLEKLPERIKPMFRKKAACCSCRELCKRKLFRTFEGVMYTDCGYGNFFEVVSYDLDDIEFYMQIILLEAKAEKASARRKGIKVIIDKN